MPLFTLHDFYFLAILTLLRLTELDPTSRSATTMAGVLSRLAYSLSRDKKRRTRENIELAFGNSVGAAEREKIVRGRFHAFWEEMFRWATRAEAGAVEFQGRAHLEAALRRGRGAILWESGFGSRTLAKQALYAHGFAVQQVHGADNLGGFKTVKQQASRVRATRVRRFFDTREKQFTAGLIYLPYAESLAFTRTLRDVLEHNAILCVTGDGVFGQKKIPLCFLGKTKYFSTGMVSLARMADAPLLPLFCFRERDGKMVLRLEAPLAAPDADRDDAQREILGQYAARLEAYIKQYPEQYRNWHFMA